MTAGRITKLGLNSLQNPTSSRKGKEVKPKLQRNLKIQKETTNGPKTQRKPPITLLCP